jgi:endonuclease/exonuclease/phosphatase family metal-dependent hydrolase
MQILSLNIWGGYLQESLVNFFEQYKNVDVFCLQEVYSNATQMITNEDRQVTLTIFEIIQKLLPEHQGYFRPVINMTYGIALFIRKSYIVNRELSQEVYCNPQYTGLGPDHNKIAQAIVFQYDTIEMTIVNFHGLWNGKGKTDSQERINQSKNLCALLDTLPKPMIIAGDFNLRPDTKSLALIEAEFKNLIREYKVCSTRTCYYPKSEKFADYILTSPEIEILDFKVLPDAVSDHSPLLLEFQLTMPIAIQDTRHNA